MQFKISGHVTAKGQGVAGLVVKAYDNDLLYDDLLGAAETDQNGFFAIDYEGEEFQELFEKSPDIYLKILTPDKKKTLMTTEDSVRFNAGREETFNIAIPPEQVEAVQRGKTETLDKRRSAMGFYYDKAGNVFQIEEKEMLTKKGTVTVFNEAGEEFEIPADKADEFKLTPDERAKVVDELRAKAMDLGKTLGICPVIDPACWSYGPRCPTFGACRIFDRWCPSFSFGPGCLAFDPAFFETVAGTQMTPYAAAQPAQLAPQVQNLLQSILNSCPNIDPVNLGSVIGTLASRNVYRFRDIFQRIGGGCPMIDPPELKYLVGTLATLQELTRATSAKAEVRVEDKEKRKAFVMKALTDPEFRNLVRTNPQKAFEKENLTPEDWQSVGRLSALLPMIDDVISNISGAILCSGGGGCGLA
jgi:hypothetical protein